MRSRLFHRRFRQQAFFSCMLPLLMLAVTPGVPAGRPPVSQDAQTSTPFALLARLPLMIQQGSALFFADHYYHFSLDLAREHPDAELVLLPDRAPAELVAQVRQDQATPGYHEIERHIDWHANSGELLPAANGDASHDYRLLVQPEGSRLVTVTATLSISLTGPGGRLQLTRQASLRLLTPAPASLLVNGVIDGFAIGPYLDPAGTKTLAKLGMVAEQYEIRKKRYARPEYYYRVDPAIKNLRISPNQTLGMHMIDFPWHSLGQTQYIALDTCLVQKLEDLLYIMRCDGVNVTHFVPIYGFRPPSFNLSTHGQQGNLKAVFSIHQYGRAIDLIIDEDGDHVLDDLNGDGIHDIRDARFIQRFVDYLDKQYAREHRMDIVGGAGVYAHNDFFEREAWLTVHGLNGQTPYIHIDTRGFLRPDGLPIRWSEEDPLTTATQPVASSQRPETLISKPQPKHNEKQISQNRPRK